MRCLLLVGLIGCSGAIPDECDTVFWRDADQDGFGGREAPWIGCTAPAGYVAGPADCGDQNASRHPDADELCNGIDDDCDGSVDNDAIDPRSWYLDQDQDAFGTAETVETACEPSAGFVAEAGDCDDTDPLSHPGAEEDCDPVDRDCDGDPQLGAVDGLALYVDQDLDGFGDPASPTEACEIAAGLVDDSSDCDDSSNEVYPGAVEGTADGVDSDCDGWETCPADMDSDGFAGEDVVLADIGCTVAPATLLVGDCDDGNPLVSPALVEIPSDGLDNDCDPLTTDGSDIDDLDGDGYPASVDCDDSDPAVNPGVLSLPSFSDVTMAAGFDQVHWDPVSQPTQCAMGEEWMTGGAAIGDVDLDGDLDVFLARPHNADLLYINQGSGTFVESGALAGVDDVGPSGAPLFFDVEGDGDLDLYVAMVGAAENRLYINDGTGVFIDEAPARGASMPLVDPTECSLQFGVSAGDADGDGDLDLWVSAWQPLWLPGTDRNALLINDGTGHFTDGTTAVLTDLTSHAGFSPQWIDHDGDGDSDMSIAGDWNSSLLLRNDGGLFSDITASSGVGTDENGMGADWADVDGDGDWDWFVTSIFDSDPLCQNSWGCTGNRLYINDGTGNYLDETDAYGLRDGAWGWGSSFADIDHDGDLDLWQQNGMPHDGFTEDVLRLYINDSGWYRDEACQQGVDYAGQGRAALPFDADGDGDLDVLLTFTADLPRLLMNDGDSALGHWLQVGLQDTGLNPYAIGAELRFTPSIGGDTLVRRLHANTTFVGVGPAEVHVGLDATTLIDVEIVWPDGATQTELGVPVDQRVIFARTVP